MISTLKKRKSLILHSLVRLTYPRQAILKGPIYQGKILILLIFKVKPKNGQADVELFSFKQFFKWELFLERKNICC